MLKVKLNGTANTPTPHDPIRKLILSPADITSFTISKLTSCNPRANVKSKPLVLPLYTSSTKDLVDDAYILHQLKKLTS
jgi:hypothetical protein